jgi:rubrerythrin
MNTVQAGNRLLEALKVHEKEIAGLYAVYAETFPTYSSFWSELSREEIEHAGWIERLQARIEDSSEVFVVERFPSAAIEKSIGYVKELVNKAEEADFELIDALSEALHLEEALSESKYFEVLEGDSDETKRTLRLLASSSRKHYEKVREVWQKNR